MKVWVVWDTHGEELYGVFASEEGAQAEVERLAAERGIDNELHGHFIAVPFEVQP